jgi:hypothetical protein
VDDGIPEGAAIPKYYAAKIELTALLEPGGVGVLVGDLTPTSPAAPPAPRWTSSSDPRT